MIEFALQYAARSWRVFPVHTTISGRCSCGRDCGKDAGKHPRIKAWQVNATTDSATIERWWKRWPDANIGIATGGGLIVLDLDGATEIEAFGAIAKPHGGLPDTLAAQTGRGFHLYLAGELGGSKKVDGLLVRGAGGYVVAPPSWHASGKPYQWVMDVPCAPAPDWFLTWAQSTEHTTVTASGLNQLASGLPAHLKNRKLTNNQRLITGRAKSGLGAGQTPEEIQRVAEALAAIPASCARDPWLHVGMALHSCHWQREDGSDLGLELWDRWSSTCPAKYSRFDVETRWRSFGKGSGIGLGTLFHIAEQHGWEGNAPREAPPPAKETNGHHSIPAVLPIEFTAPNNKSPLIELNTKYCCIGDVGGKCLVLGWVPSKVDPLVEVPSFQTFKSFAERYGHRYVLAGKKTEDDDEQEQKQLGAYWLKWRQRKSYDGIDLIPGEGQTVGGNVLNLWRGWSVKPKPGSWDRMKAHMAEVLADGNMDALDYIVKWSAWAVQNPGQRAESALVFRGGKGSGKGTFAHAMRRLFGAHGLHISNPKHLVGAFNAHLRNCLLLYADEAFWAGDKQGESTLKALITESTLTIEQKGVDAVQWYNRIHLIMTANAEWVVPASHDERRYVVLNVSEKRMDDRGYFDALHIELENGGLAAMLHELQALDLKGWHPRQILRTQALLEQKMQSMNPLQEWWESMLQEGLIPAAPKDTPDSAMAVYLLHSAREFAPKLKDLTPTRLGRFLADHGCVKLHRNNGNAWRFPVLDKARETWARRYQGWKWESGAGEWSVRV